jgi:hypothetical protein
MLDIAGMRAVFSLMGCIVRERLSTGRTDHGSDCLVSHQVCMGAPILLPTGCRAECFLAMSRRIEKLCAAVLTYRTGFRLFFYGQNLVSSTK